MKSLRCSFIIVIMPLYIVAIMFSILLPVSYEIQYYYNVFVLKDLINEDNTRTLF